MTGRMACRYTSKNNHTRTVMAEGMEFVSVNASARSLGVHPSTILYRIRSGKEGYAHIGPPVDKGRRSPGRPRGNRSAWVAESEVERIARLYMEGRTVSEICRAVGRSPHAVNVHLQRRAGGPPGGIRERISS